MKQWRVVIYIDRIIDFNVDCLRRFKLPDGSETPRINPGIPKVFFMKVNAFSHNFVLEIELPAQELEKQPNDFTEAYTIAMKNSPSVKNKEVSILKSLLNKDIEKAIE